MSEWRSLSSNLIPNAVLPTLFYSDCLKILSSVRLDDDDDCNSRGIDKLLLVKQSSPPSFHGIGSLSWARDFLLQVIGLAFVTISARILKMIFFGLLL